MDTAPYRYNTKQNEHETLDTRLMENTIRYENVYTLMEDNKSSDPPNLSIR